MEKTQNFPLFFGCISALGMSYSFKNMKVIVKSHQIMKFKEMFTSWFGSGIMSKTIFYIIQEE